jgi:hypothetical protein
MFENANMPFKLIVFLKSNEGITSVDDVKDFSEIRFGVIILLFLNTKQLQSRY